MYHAPSRALGSLESAARCMGFWAQSCDFPMSRVCLPRLFPIHPSGFSSFPGSNFISSCAFYYAGHVNAHDVSKSGRRRDPCAYPEYPSCTRFVQLDPSSQNGHHLQKSA